MYCGIFFQDIDTKMVEWYTIYIDFMRDEMMILRAMKRLDNMRNRIGVLHGFCVQDLCIFAYCFCADGSQKGIQE